MTAVVFGKVVVDVEVRGSFDLTDYVEHLARTPARCGIASGTAPATVALSFSVERTWRYATALVSRRAPGLVSVEVDAAVEDAQIVAHQACRILSLDVDGSGFPAVVAGDPMLARRVRAGPGLRPVLFGSPYEAACWAVVCHRLRVAQADALVRRIAEHRGRVQRVGGREVLCFPAPQDLGGLDSAYGLSGVKRRRLEVIAEAALAGELDAARLRDLPVDVALETVRRLPGIGPFSAELVVGRGAGHPDLFPNAESHLVAALRRHYDTDDAGVAAVAGLWQPYRGWASFFFREVSIDEQ